MPSTIASGLPHALRPALAAAAAAVAASLIAAAQPAEARTSFGNPAVTLLVSRTTETAVAFSTRLSASCLVGDGASAPAQLNADVAGTVRFHARTDPNAPPAILLTAACNDGHTAWTVPLIVRSVNGIVRNPIPPPVVDMSYHLPAGFDPANASDAELARLGLTHRPDRVADPDLYLSWMHAVQYGVRVAPGAIARDEYSTPPTQLNTSNWSGILANGKTSQYTSLVGTWNVPAVAAPYPDLPALSVMWVGIDGADKTKGLYQTGTAQYVYRASGVTITSYFGWYEVVPGYPITQFTNFVVNPGDQVYADTIDCSTGGKTTLCFDLIDYTMNNEEVSASLTTKGKVTHGCAEWIMERPSTKQGFHAMPQYGKFVASGMDVYDTFLGSWTKYATESHDKIYMYNGNDLLAEAGGTSSGDKAVYTWINFL